MASQELQARQTNQNWLKISIDGADMAQMILLKQTFITMMILQEVVG